MKGKPHPYWMRLTCITRKSTEMMERDFQGQVIKDILTSILVPFDYSGESQLTCHEDTWAALQKDTGRNWGLPPVAGEAWSLPASRSVTAPSLKQILWSQQISQGMAVLSSILTEASWKTAEPEINKRFLTHRDFEETNFCCLELLVVRWFVM